jgi:hypothetical protein
VKAQDTKILFGPRQGDYAGTIFTYDNARIDVDLWIRTSPELAVSMFHIPLSTDNEYFVERMGGSTDFYPLSEWDDRLFLPPNEDPYNENFTNQSLLALCSFTYHCESHIETEGEWLKIAEFRMTVGSADQYDIPIWDVFAEGYYPRINRSVLINYDCSKLERASYEILYGPIQFVENPCAGDMSGDFNGDGYFNMADITDSYAKLKFGIPGAACYLECPLGSGSEWPVAMDLNNSCSFNLADVIIAYKKFRGGSIQFMPCEYCPPEP